MKGFIIIILVFSFSVSIFAKENKFNGFGKIKWGESIKKYKNVMHLTSDERKSSKYYTRKNDQMSLSDVSLTSITYLFYKGRFSSAIIQTSQSLENSRQTLTMLKKKYGKPFYSSKYRNKYRWKDSVTMVSLKCYPSSHKCSVIYNSVVMENLKKADNDKAAKNMRNGLYNK